MATISLKLKDSQIDSIYNLYKDNIKQVNNQYVKYYFDLNKSNITVYTSNSVVFNGDNAYELALNYFPTNNNRQAGSDEVGTGDTFGPIVVCAAIIETSDYEYINKQNITDSKKISDEKIMKIGPELIKKFKHSLIILDNVRYNEMNKKYNMNAIKAMLHNQSYINLIDKGYDIPKACIVDQFTPKDNYYGYLLNQPKVYDKLVFETKAESKYPAVAVASCIARYAFLVKFNELEKKYNMNLPKGSSDESIHDTIDLFIEKYSKNRLNEICKLNFINKGE